MRRMLALTGLLALLAAPAAAEEHDALQRAFVYWQQGYLYHMAGRYERAVEYFERSIQAQPTAEGHTFLGWSLSRLGQLEEAIEQCEIAIEIDPGYGNPYNDIGVYLMDLGRHDEAGPWFLEAMEAERYCCYQYPHFNYGRLLVMEGDLERARMHFQRALGYDPGYTPARRALELLAEMGEEL